MESRENGSAVARGAPYDWHKRPVGSIGHACPICSCPNVRQGEHRAVAESEGKAEKWIKRKLRGINWPGQYNYVKMFDVDPVEGMDIHQVAEAVACGTPLVEIAERFGICPAAITRWQEQHRTAWHGVRRGSPVHVLVARLLLRRWLWARRPTSARAAKVIVEGSGMV